MRRRLLISLLAGALLLGCSGSHGPDPNVTPIAPTNGEITVRASEWGYDPPAIVVQKGEQVTLKFDNGGTILHNLRITGLEGEVISWHSSGPLANEEDALFVGALAGEQGDITFIPQQTGEFTFYCTIFGHSQLGMVGNLIVE